VPSPSDPPPMVCLVSRGISCLPWYNLLPAVQLISRFGSSPLPTSRGITRHHATSRNIMRHTVTSRNPHGTSHLPLPTRLSCDIPRHPAAPTSIAPVPSLGYPTTSQDPVVSPAAPCEIHDTTTSSGPSHYPPTSLPSNPLLVPHPAPRLARPQ